MNIFSIASINFQVVVIKSKLELDVIFHFIVIQIYLVFCEAYKQECSVRLERCNKEKKAV